MNRSRAAIFIFWAAFVGFAVPSAPAARQGMMQIKGSDSEVNLVQRLAEVFMQKHPDANIAVTGGGSGTGIAALINKKTDIANSSRDLSPKEEEAAKKAGVHPFRVVFATDAISAVVHPSNPVNRLSMDQLGKIFKGQITNWKEVGGKETRISLYGRQSNSGTYIFFREFVLKGDYSPHMKSMNGTAQIVEALKRDEAGIGYVAVGYVVTEKEEVMPGIKILNVAKDEKGEAYNPIKMENVMTGKYPISRPLNQYTSGRPSGTLLEFIRFELSAEGQKIVRQQGFFPVQKQWTEFNRKQGVI